MINDNQQRIALISFHGDPAIEIGKEEAGGQNVYVRNVGEALAKLGWRVDMFTRHGNRRQAEIVEHLPNCRTIRLKAGPVEFIPRDRLFGNLPEFIENILLFAQENQISYPLVHTNYWLSGWTGMELKKHLNCKLIHTYHSLGAVKYATVDNIPSVASQRLEVEKQILETVERVVATSPQEKAHMRQLVSVAGNIDIIPCGTDIRSFGSISSQAARAQLGIEADTKLILYVGRFDRRKGIETLVRAVHASKSYSREKLRVIIGGGSRPGESDGLERDRIEAIVNELGIQDICTFPGRLSQEILPSYYAAADVCVVPSHYEPFGLVAIEAMASGTPVIASDVGGLQYTVISEETGLLAPPQDVAAFARAIDRIIADPQWCQQLGIAAKQRVQAKFSWDGVAQQLSNLYSQLLQSQLQEHALLATAS